MSNADERMTTVYFQRYSLPGLNHTEQASSYTFCEETSPGVIGNGISDLFYDGTDYWIVDRFLGRVSRWTSALVFDGLFTGPIGARRYYINGEYWYTVAGSIQTGDPLLVDSNMTNYGIPSGIGKWHVTSEPSPITSDVGTFTHDSAKPIVAETHVGYRAVNTTLIHDIIYVDSADATHLTPGIWVVITFNRTMFLFRIIERSTHYEVLESVNVNYAGDSHSSPYPDDFPYEIIHLDVD